MATSLSECDQLSGRKRQLCRCDGPLVDVGLSNQYRQHWGLPPHSERLITHSDLNSVYRRGEGFRRLIVNGRLIKHKPDTGLGDTIDRLLFYTGQQVRIKTILEKWFGSCGCDGRRRRLNRWFPYSGITWKRRMQWCLGWGGNRQP